MGLSNETAEAKFKRTERRYKILYLDRDGKAQEASATGYRRDCFLVAEVRLEDGRPNKAWRAGWHVWHIPTHMMCSPHIFSGMGVALEVVEMALKLVPLHHWQFEYAWTDREANRKQASKMIGGIRLKYAFQRAEKLVLLR